MRYTDLIENYGFARNMQETNWLKLFPHWWSENDPLLETIGKEVGFLKAQGIFTLLNTMVKPPVMVWQNSVVEKEYTISDKITTLTIIEENDSNIIECQAPLYKTFGHIELVSYADENIHNLKIAFTDTDYIIIKTIIKPQDIVIIDIGSQKVTINGKEAIVQKFGDGVSYFKTQKQEKDISQWDPKKHYFSNEILRLTLTSDYDYDDVNIDIDVVLDNVVFINEQNIEITGLELVPIKSVDIYIYYDFPFNQKVNGWQKASDKVYIEDTNVVYDMITTKFPVKKFYVDVWYKGLDYPYRVGFPADKNADDESIYHVNKELDTWGEYFGLKRRFYKENIPEEDYPYTYPEYYPYNIEQDYWYYQRLINEYTYTEWAINDVDLLDTDGTPIVRLHAINPFVEDLVVHAKSIYPDNENGIRTKRFTPTVVSQELLNEEDSQYRKSEYHDIQNLLKYDDNKAYITLRNKIGAGITYQQYLSKVLKTFFDLKDIAADVHIDDLKILVEAEATDNKDNKYSNNNTGIIIHGISDDYVFPLKQDSIYELTEKEITYNLSISMDDIKSHITTVDNNIVHEATIDVFQGVGNDYVYIPFTLRENDEIVNDITDVYITLNQYRTIAGEYKDGYIKVFIPNKAIPYFDSISIACKTLKHDSFIANDIPITKVINDEDNNTFALEELMIVTDEWHTADLRNILQKDGISFVNVFQNDDETNTPTILIKNITLEVSYSPKQTEFELNTQVIYEAEKPAIAQLKVEVINTGDKDFVSIVDVVSATNLKLNKNHFTVDLKIGDTHTEYITIIPEYPLSDGQYEILTVCEDKSRTNNVFTSGEGLLQTNVILKDHYGTLGNDIVLQATVNNTAKQIIEYGKVSFYVDDYYIGEDSALINNVGTVTLPSDSKHITAGLHTLEARFSGTAKYQSSRSHAYLSILRTDIIMDITNMPNKVTNGQKMIGSVAFFNTDGTPFVPNENENNKVSFYIDDLFLGNAEIGLDGTVAFESDNIDLNPGSYTLIVNYQGNGHYVQQQQTKTINVVGGKTNIIVFEQNAKPTDFVDFKAKITDSLNHPVDSGTVTFLLDDVIIGTVDVIDGSAILRDYMVANIEKTYIITAQYNDTTYQPSEGQSRLVVKKGTVVISNASIFYASQHEPLGFYLNVADVNTNAPVQTGKVIIDISSLGIICEGTVDLDGGVRILHNVVNFSSKDLQDLEKFRFSVDYDLDDILNSDQTLTYTREDIDDEQELLLMNFYRDQNDKEAELIFKYLKPVDTIETVDENNIVINELPPGFEQIYIKDGYLFARTNIDVLRQYLTGQFPITITYVSNDLYNSSVKNGSLLLQEQNINIDLMSYDLTYNEKNESLTCYVSTYNIDNDEYQPINQGSIQFYVDNTFLGQSIIMDGRAILSPSYLKEIEDGNHLLQAVYIPKQGRNNTYTYTSLSLHKIRSTIYARFDTTIKGRKNKLNVSVCIDNEYDMSIDGDIEVYLNDVRVTSDYLFGMETDKAWIADTEYEEENTNVGDHCATLSFMIDIPDDADISTYEVKVKYLGSSHIEASETILTVQHEKINTSMSDYNVKVANDEMCKLCVEVESEFDDFINEGEVVLSYGNKIIAKDNVKNSKAILTWISDQALSDMDYDLNYKNAEHYNDCHGNVHVTSIEPLNDIYIRQNRENDIEFDETGKEMMTDINDALQCLAVGGTIHLVNEVIVIDNIDIQKDINIVGHNDAKIIKDIGDLLSDDDNNIKIYNYDEFNEIIYEIIGLSSKYINDRDFCIIDNDLYYITATNDFVPIFLLDDGNFYSYQLRSLSSIVSNVNINIANVNVNIENVNFITEDSDDFDDFIINNKGTLNIGQCVLNKNVKIVNYNNANINCNLVYCSIDNYGTINKDNNWWGSNTINDESINNHIILTLWTDETPPVIGDDIEIYGQLIGANGIEYDLPPVEFFFEADNGFFSIENGYTIDNYIYTTYFDSTKEDKVFCTVDNEVLSLDILNYDRKTEVLMDPIDIPIGYQVELIANVHSCADYYYDNKIVNNGYVTFYLYNDEAEDYETLGRARIIAGKATLPVYFSSQQYSSDVKTVLATYTPEDYYFTSKNQIDITLIDADQVCYVSPDGQNGDGTFYNPVSSIRQAIELHKQIIYLKEGIYNDEQIDVDENIHIKKYYGDVIFKDHNNIIFINANENEHYDMTLDGIIFENNNASIAQNFNNVIIKHCIFQNNTSDHLFNMNEMVEMETSVLIGNSNIIFPLMHESDGITRPSYNINYCWYGCNLNEVDNIDNLTGYNTPQTYVIMDVEYSKDKIYIGSVAKIIASLNKYVYFDNPENKYDMIDILPKREAFFCTEIGTIMPSKDYTYHNQATAFLNTMEEKDINDIIIVFPDNTNYMYQNVKLQCYVQNIYGQAQNGVEIYFEVRDKDNQIINKGKDISEDGIAGITMTALSRGTYTLVCKTTDGVQAINYFTVIPANIQVTECIIEDGDHLYDLKFTLKCVNPFGENINNQMVDIYIDDTYIDYDIIVNGSLTKAIQYMNIPQGKHTLKITTKGYESNFEELTYEKDFTSTKKDTYITFNDEGVAPQESTDLVVYVYDNKNKPVLNGYIDIKFDHQTVYIDEDGTYSSTETENYTIKLQNGIGVLYDFVCENIGQHTITIHYSGDNDYYNECLMNKKLNVDVEEVILTPKVTPITANIGSPLRFDMTVTDQSYRKIKRGYISVYLDDIAIDKKAYVKDGEVNFNEDLPIGIQADTSYALKVVYQDPDQKYANTTYSVALRIGEIPTQIVISTVYGSPGLDTDPMPYYIESPQGTVSFGTLTAYYDNQEIGRATLPNDIVLHIPKMPVNDVETVFFKYVDGVNGYSNSELSMPLILNKSKVNISTSMSGYYPKQAFNFIASCKDNQDQHLLSGQLTLYIDNVKHSTRDIVNGQAIFSLKFNTIKQYQLLLVYEEDDYYERSIYEQEFSVTNIPITNIAIDGLDNVIPNTLHEVELIFDTENNLAVNDGYVDIYFNNKKINTYAIVQGRKIVQLNIPDLESNKAYNMKIEYYNSSTFTDYSNDEYECVLNYIPFEIDVNPIIATANDVIDIISSFSYEEQSVYLTGILEYWLEEENGSRRLVDVTSINNVNYYSHSYMLPTDLNGDERYIVVKYVGDTQHQEEEGKASLNIQKTDIQLENLPDQIIYVQYQHDLSFSFNMSIPIQHDFYISLNNIPLKPVTSDTDGVVNFVHTLQSEIEVGTYSLHIVSPETATFNEYENTEEIIVKVIQTNPIFEDFKPIWTGDDAVFIGSEITLPHQVKDYNGININGSFTYTINNQELNHNNYKMILSETNNTVIDIHWEANNNDNFADIDNSIEVEMKKNDVIVEIRNRDTIYLENSNIGTVYRGQTDIPLEVILKSYTTTNTNYPQYKVYVEDNEVIYSNNKFDMPMDLPDQTQYTLHIKYQATEQVFSHIFNDFDGQFILENENIDIVTVSNVGTGANVTRTLTEALDLVKDYGTIVIEKDIEYEKCTNSKHITIEGNSKTFANCSIQNDGVLTINDVRFTRTENEYYSAIVTNNKLYVKNCTFIDQKAQYGAAIYIDSKNKNTEIIECTFNANDASLYGGAIFSNKGNDVKIQSCTFGESNYANNHGSSISTNGNMYIKDNIFYGNNGNDEIYVMGGTLEAEDNFFDAKIGTIFNYNGIVSANLNYWGYNDNDSIQTTWQGPAGISIDNWLISDYEIHYTEPELNRPQKHITGVVNKYQNKMEDEITTYKNINGKMFLDTYYDLNTPQITNIDIIKIGQEVFVLNEVLP